MKIRARKGVSRYRVAKDTGVPATTLQRLETGQPTVQLEHLVALMDYYGVTDVRRLV